MLCYMFYLQAQNLVVQNFYKSEDNLTVNSESTIVKDQNGKKCALIKVKSPIIGLNFDVGSLGIVKTESKKGETWVYVPEGVKRITISHRRFGVLRDYDLGQALKQAKTYSLELGLDGETGGETDELKKAITFQLIPSNAVIKVDDQSLKSENGFVVTMLSYGTHQYRVSASGYVSQDGEVKVNDSIDHQVININLDLKKNENESRSFDFSITPDIETIKSQHPSRVVFNINDIEFAMIYVEGGILPVEDVHAVVLDTNTLQITDLAGEGEGNKHEIQQGKGIKQIQVSSFYIGETEITQELWETIMGNNSSIDLGADRPVECITWNDCRKFYGKMRLITGVQFRLPYEKEWEYAAKGGKLTHNYKYSGSNNIEKVAWYEKNAFKVSLDKIKASSIKGWIAKVQGGIIGAQPVKRKKANELGIYDMTGNLWEWCLDGVNLNIDTEEEKKNSKYYAIRGGCWDSKSEDCIISNRNYLEPNTFSDRVGMRLVCDF